MENSHGCPRRVKNVSLEELRDRLAEFARVREWEQYHSPRNLLLALVGEVGELSEIFQWKGEVARGLPNWSPTDKEHLEEELSDVLLCLVQLADVCGLDLGQAALTKIHKNAQKYPVNPKISDTTNFPNSYP
ncbi:DCTP pyrophosphatase [Actinidia chinensis var. chinensis]|uniref:dCTP pyrophosphatase 1 n=1 Tax=Actinidia chinensis var. chinensis TaxID=1590841 RepID=A0A2R6PU66_ACTCC|nr:DCTP pyrophosphatase [Actinidia chinensis var. chinensis]